MSKIFDQSRRFSAIEQLTLGSYYFVSFGVNCVQLTIKIAVIAFSYLISLPFTSPAIRTWVKGHVSDAIVSYKLVRYSLFGIHNPKKLTQYINLLNAQSVNDLGEFTFDMVNKITIKEKFGISLQFCLNLIKELFSTVFATMRYVFAFIGDILHLKQNEEFNSILFHEFFLLSGHTANAFDSLEGIFLPKKQSFKLIQSKPCKVSKKNNFLNF